MRSIRTFALALGLGRDVFVCLPTEFGKSLYMLRSSSARVRMSERPQKVDCSVHFPVDGSNDGTA